MDPTARSTTAAPVHEHGCCERTAAHHEPGTTSIGVDEAVDRIRRHPPVPGTEDVPVAECLRRVLAEDVVARFPVPGHDSSAVDGYAFRFDELDGHRKLRVAGRVAAGRPAGVPRPPGTASRIFTGGVVPAGADTVAMQEDCHVADGFVTLPAHLRRGDNRRLAGEDVAAGATVLRAGSRLRPQDVGQAASVGRASLTVRRVLRVGVVATGDELRAPGEPLPPGCVHDSNRYCVRAALEVLGARVTTYPGVGDSRSAIARAFESAALGNDLVISTGGVSAGEEDHVQDVVRAAGRLDFWQLRLKPGRPVAMGHVHGTPFVGLPGNPVAAMVTFWLVGRPLALRLMGVSDVEPMRFSVTSGFEHRRAAGRRELLRARVGPDATGRLVAQTYRSTSSGMLSSLTWSNGLVDIPEHTGDVRVGDPVDFVPYHGLD